MFLYISNLLHFVYYIVSLERSTPFYLAYVHDSLKLYFRDNPTHAALTSVLFLYSSRVGFCAIPFADQDWNYTSETSSFRCSRMSAQKRPKTDSASLHNASITFAIGKKTFSCLRERRRCRCHPRSCNHQAANTDNQITRDAP